VAGVADLKGARVLVTGAGGFIGSHLTEYLVAAGARTRAFVHYRGNGSWGWLDQSPCKDDIEVVAGDIGDAGSVHEAMRGVDVVFHLAALIGIPYSYVAPQSYVRTNIDGTLNVLQAARALGVSRVVHTSTSEAYGTALYVPIDEKHPLQGQSPYSATKIGADKLAESFFLSFGLPVATVRPFNTFGPRQSTRAVIPTIITQGLAGGAVRLGHLHPTRDLNFVGDIVRGFASAGVSAAAVGRTVNLGTGREISIADLAALIGQLLGREIVIEGDAARTRPEGSEVDRLLADNTLAREVLSWTPEVTLEQGLATTIEWISGNRDAYRTGHYAV
jgi:NAD dependent epimerase/dehydratase